MSDQNLQNLDTGLPRKPLSASPEGTDLATSVPSAGNIHNHSAMSDRDRDLSASAKQIQSSGESESSIENVTTCQSSMRRMAISNILNLAEPPETNTPPQQPIQYSSFPNPKVPGRLLECLSCPTITAGNILPPLLSRSYTDPPGPTTTKINLPGIAIIGLSKNLPSPQVHDTRFDHVGSHPTTLSIPPRSRIPPPLQVHDTRLQWVPPVTVSRSSSRKSMQSCIKFEPQDSSVNRYQGTRKVVTWRLYNHEYLDPRHTNQRVIKNLNKDKNIPPRPELLKDDSANHYNAKNPRPRSELLKDDSANQYNKKLPPRPKLSKVDSANQYNNKNLPPRPELLKVYLGNQSAIDKHFAELIFWSKECIRLIGTDDYETARTRMLQWTEAEMEAYRDSTYYKIHQRPPPEWIVKSNKWPELAL